MKNTKTKNMVMIAMLGAIAAVLMVLEISVPLAPTFIKLDFSDLPIILGGFLMGPVAGVCVAAIKVLINLLLNGTSTMYVGEFANFALAAAYVLPASIIYAKQKNKKSAIKGLVVSVIVTSLFAILLNVYVVFPMYAKLFHMSFADIVGMVSATNPLVKSTFSMVVFSLLPFNLFKYSLVSVITMLTYKKLSHWFKK